MDETKIANPDNITTPCEPEQENRVPNVVPVATATQKRPHPGQVFSARVMQPTESSRQRTAASAITNLPRNVGRTGPPQNRTAGGSNRTTGGSTATRTQNRTGSTLYRPGGGTTTSSSRLTTRATVPAKTVKPLTRDGPVKRIAPSGLGSPTLDCRAVEGLSGQVKLLQTQITNLSQNIMSLSPEVAPLPQVVTDLAVCTNEIQQAEELLRQQVSEQTKLETRHRLESNVLENRLLLLQTQLETTQVSLGMARSEKIQNHGKLTQLEEDIFRTTSELGTTTEQMDMEKKTMMECMEKEISETEQRLSGELRNITEQADAMERLTWDRQTTLQNLEATLTCQKSRIHHLDQKSRQDETLRKHLHECIQELKGNIRVMCRVRPPLGSETMDGISHIFPSPQELLIEVSGGKDVTGCPTPKMVHPFKFDRVFGPMVSQGAVFEEISHLVQSSLDGYNCCIFAYGQTGSGKTYTMEGGKDPEDEAARGMITRAVQQVFKASDRLKPQGWLYEMRASFLEIYNDTIIDLLVKCPKEKKTLDLKHDQKNGKTTVPDLTSVKVKTPARVFDLLARATSNRKTAETSMNPNSSRSHSVFQLLIIGNNSGTGETVEGLLNLIDLAGSEKLEQSKVSGILKKETICINQSLSHLSHVFSAIAKNEKHIPYRSSKLTFLLQNSLGGSAKTIMFVNISPAAENLKETLSSLRFATTVNACEIGTAKKSTKVKVN